MAAPIRQAADDRSDVARQVRIIPEKIEEEYAAVSADLHRWASRYAEASKLHDLAELEAKAAVSKEELKAEIAEERLRLEMRKTQTGNNDVIHAHVVSDPRYEAAHDKVIEVRKDHAKLVAEAAERKSYAGGMMKAIEAKKEMLISLGAHLRQEMEREPSIRERRR